MVLKWLKLCSTLPIMKKKYALKILLHYRQPFIKGNIIIGEWEIFGAEVFLHYSQFVIKGDFIIGRDECKCFCSSQHSWRLLCSERGVTNAELVTPPLVCESTLALGLLLVTPPSPRESLALGSPAGDSCSGFWGQSTSVSMPVSVVGSLNHATCETYRLNL